MLVDKLFEHFW